MDEDAGRDNSVEREAIRYDVERLRHEVDQLSLRVNDLGPAYRHIFEYLATASSFTTLAEDHLR